MVGFLVRNNHSGLVRKMSSDMSEGDNSEALMGLGKFSMRYAYWAEGPGKHVCFDLRQEKYLLRVYRLED